MKKHTKTDWLVLITTCLAAGGIGTVIIFCFLIGFGLNTMVGKEALYIGAGLLLINLIVIWRREARLEAGMTPILRRMHTIFVWTWKIGAVLLLIALVPRPMASIVSLRRASKRSLIWLKSVMLSLTSRFHAEFLSFEEHFHAAL